MSGPRSGERGFTLVELLIATGIWVVLAGMLLFVTQGLFASARVMIEQRREYSQLSQLVETWEAESSSALAIFVPARDLLGNSNADGHEFDFYSRDAAHAGRFWAYRWDAATQTIQRYSYPSAGAPATPSGAPLERVQSLRALRKAASTLRAPFLNGYVPKDVAVNFGYPGVDGGNAIVDVVVANARGSREIELLPGTMPSGFAVVVSSFTPKPATPPPTADPCAFAQWYVWSPLALRWYLATGPGGTAQFGYFAPDGSFAVCSTSVTPPPDPPTAAPATAAPATAAPATAAPATASPAPATSQPNSPAPGTPAPHAQAYVSSCPAQGYGTYLYTNGTTDYYADGTSNCTATAPPSIPPRPANVVHHLKCWSEPDPHTTWFVDVIDTWTWDPSTWSWILVPGTPPNGDVFCS